MDRFRYVMRIVGLVIFLFWLFVAAGTLTILPIYLIWKMVHTVGFSINECGMIIGQSIVCSCVSTFGAMIGLFIGTVFKKKNYI